MPKGRNEKQYIKLLIIRDFLYSHTNENHYVTSLDIQKHLEKKGISADRKTIFADINRLEDDYRMDIVRGGRKGYRVASPQFEPNELRLLIDSVQSAKFITQDEATAITGKIKNLTDVYTRPTLERKAFVSERVQNMKESIVSHTDVIHEAINLDSQISFKYAHYKPSLSKNTKRYSKGGDPFIVSPFALYWNNGNYYLYAYLSEKKQMRFFRIDRMESIKLASEKREGHELFSEKTLRSRRKAKVFDMYSTGNEEKVTLRGLSFLADQVIDTFGKNHLFIPDREDPNFFTVEVLVDVSPTFFAWVSTFGRQLTITYPPNVKAQMVDFLNKSLEGHSK